jgi:hypothetical protein
MDKPVPEPPATEQRRPGQVPDEPGPGIAGLPCFDTDGDGVLDTAVTTDGIDLVVLTDLDGDRFADQVLRIGLDGTVRETLPPHPGPHPGPPLADGPPGAAADWASGP